VNGRSTTLLYWLMGAMLTIGTALGAANLAMTQSRLDKIETRQEIAIIERQQIDARMHAMNLILSERLARIEEKLTR
jgi:hypothetical protein